MNTGCATLAVVNFRPIKGDRARNAARLIEYTEAAAKQGAQMILFPELALCGRTSEQQRQAAQPVPGEVSRRMAETACQLGVFVIFGMPTVRDGHFYNSLLACDPQGSVQVYDKLHLTEEDRRWATPGDRLPPLIDTPYGRFVLAAGEETIYFPEICRYGKAMGANLLLCAAAWTQTDMAGAWQKILGRIVGCNTLPVAVAALAGEGYLGGSQILSPGEPIEQAHLLAGTALDAPDRAWPALHLFALDWNTDRLMPHYPYYEHNFKVGTPDWRPDLYQKMTEEVIHGKEGFS